MEGPQPACRICAGIATQTRHPLPPRLPWSHANANPYFVSGTYSSCGSLYPCSGEKCRSHSQQCINVLTFSWSGYRQPYSISSIGEWWISQSTGMSFLPTAFKRAPENQPSAFSKPAFRPLAGRVLSGCRGCFARQALPIPISAH